MARGAIGLCESVVDLILAGSIPCAEPSQHGRDCSHAADPAEIESDAANLFVGALLEPPQPVLLQDAALKNALGAITRQYRYILIDSPGGLEHLNRKIANDIDIIFDIMGPSSKSFAHVRRAHRVIQETGIRFTRFYVIAGYAFPDNLTPRVAAETGLPYGGKIEEDPYVAEHVMAGQSLLDTPGQSPAFRSVSSILDAILQKP